jgi:hypothetical protein
LHEEVAKCGVLLAVIGPNWSAARDEDGKRRLDDPKDFVRIEIAAALQRNIPVIPILLDGARIPKVNELPNDLKGLTSRNGLHVRHASFHEDMDRSVPLRPASTTRVISSGTTRTATLTASSPLQRTRHRLGI